MQREVTCCRPSRHRLRAASQASPVDLSTTRQILSGLKGGEEELLRSSDAFWKALKEQPARRGPNVVRTRHRRIPSKVEFDVCVCGGTLGIFVATALQMRGHKVAIVEKNGLEGREQEWNISRHELQELVRHGVTTAAELEEAIVTEYNPSRISFTDKLKLEVRDVLNIGVSPRLLIAGMKRRFLEVGGTLYEYTAFKSCETYHDGVLIKVGSSRQSPEASSASERSPHQTSSGGEASASGPPEQVSARLLVDCMGHWSPIVRQMRGSKKPDGICLVVGGCASGVPPAENRSGDFLRTISDAKDDMQLFWEAFPAEGGSARTTYMFCYCDTDRKRPSLEAMLDLYFQQLPQYLGLPLSKLKFKRVLFAGLPCYENGPLQPQFDRIIQVGDASASASPLSFGGFGSMVRHLGRLSKGLDSALNEDALSCQKLKLLQMGNPALACAWLFQRSMSFKVGQVRESRGRRGEVSGTLPADHVNSLLASNFRVMSFLGDRVLRPFLQDTIKWVPLTLAMNGTLLSNPVVISRVFFQVGPKLLLRWFKHYWAMAAYSLLYCLARPLRGVIKGYTFARLLEAWCFGAGLDSTYHPPSPAPSQT